MSGEVVDDPRVEHPTCATSDRVEGELAAPDRVEQRGDSRRPRDPRGDRDLVPCQPIRTAPALPQLVDVEHAPLDLSGQPELGRVPAHLTRCGGPVVSELLTASQRGHGHTGAFEWRTASRECREEGREHVARVRVVGTPRRNAHRELVADQPGGLVGVAGAADVVQERGVEGGPHIVVVDVE